MGLFDRFRSQSPETAFWAWFRRHETALFEFERDQELAFGQLATALRRVHPDLVFEVGPVEHGRREFVISAGGIREAFPAVVALVAAAPHLPRWQITQFRPAREIPAKLEFAGVSVDAETVLVQCEKDGERWSLTLYIPGYRPTPEKIYEQIGYLLLDRTLGEYAVETRVGFIGFGASTPSAVESVIPLCDLTRVMDGGRAG